MYMKIDLKSKLEKAGAIGVGAARAGQALAFAMPFMIQEENADFKPVGVDNNIVVIEHTLTGRRYKVCTSKTFRFDISPSFTKGTGRSKIGIGSAKYHVSQIADGVAFCRVVGKDTIQVLFKNLSQIEPNSDGVVTLTDQFLDKAK